MVDCDNCGAYSYSSLAESVCIHCFKKLKKENRKLRKRLDKYTKGGKSVTGENG